MGWKSILSVHGDSNGTGWNNNSSSSSNESVMNNYKSKNCDELLKQKGLVTIAEINANKEMAIARIQLEGWKYNVDANKTVGLANADANKSVGLANANAAKTVGIVNGVSNVISSSITSSNQSQQAKTLANAEVEKERIRAQAEIEKEKLRLKRDKLASASVIDPITQMLTQWGWTRVQCLPDVAFIAGLANETICVNPSPSLPAGQYNFDRTSNQLIPISTTQILQPARTIQSPIENNF